MPFLLSVLLAIMLLAAPSASMAQQRQTNAPSGNSAIDEYLETVPGATGNQRPRSPAAGGGAGNTALTGAQRARLERAGPDGRSLADVVDRTAPTTGATPQKRTLQPSGEPGRAPLGEVLDAATGQGGGGAMGALLPAILLTSLLGAVALVVLRRRSLS